MAQAGRAPGAEGVNVLQRLAQDFVVEVQNGIEYLVFLDLGAGGHLTVARQVEVFQFLLAGKRVGMAFRAVT